MPTTVITNLDALTGPTTTGDLLNMTDSAPNTMGCDLSGSDSDSGSMISSQTKKAEVFAPDPFGVGPYQCVMTVDYDGAIVQIPADAQIYKIEISAFADYTANANAQYTRTAGSGNVNGQVAVAATVFLDDDSTFTPTTSQIINDGDSDSATITTTSFNISAAISGTPTLRTEYNFEPAGSNPDAPAGYISRATLVAQFTTMRTSMGVDALATVQTAVNNGTFSVLGNAALQISIWILRVFWNPGAVVTDISPDPATDDDTITLDGTGLDNIPNITVNFGSQTGVACTILTQSATQITLQLPNMGIFEGTATLFNGAVALGTLTIYVATGSGIYRIVVNKRNDTQYDRATGSTTDVAIPEPFGETGFIGG